jgi:hypothetical protein
MFFLALFFLVNSNFEVAMIGNDGFTAMSEAY